MKSLISLRMFFLTFVFIFLALCATKSFAGNKGNQKNLWQKSDASRITSNGQRGLFPEKAVTFKLNAEMLKGFLSQMPAEFSEAAENNSVIIEIPMPDGSVSKFRIEETTILAEHLRRDFPAWKTFRGVSIDETNAVGQFDWTDKGFHGYIFTPKGTVYIDPFQENDTQNYLVYYKHEFGKSSGGNFVCKFDNGFGDSLGLENLRFQAFAPQFSNGANIRTYRIAVATTGEWSRGTTMSTDPITVRTAALAALTTSVNRLDGIYRREMSVSLQLVNPSINNEMTNIIFDDPATDPYDNTDGEAQLGINHTTITNRVGTANFDVGHLYGTGGGGVALSPSVCDNGSKAQGYSARAGFYGDPFTVDYAAHEVGHQFGASHTYNNADMGGACTTRSAQNAFEVASGSTLMSYVGICNSRNLQQYVDTGFPSFHIRSLTQMIDYVQNGEGNTCGTPSGTNNVPTVNAGGSFTIPRLTPFILTATGNDADAADVPNLLYSWEQYDLAPSSSGQIGTPAGTYDVDTDGVLRPLFRAYSPVSSNSRTFPSLTFILNPGNNDPAGTNQPPLTYTGTHPTGFPGAVCETMVTCVVGERLPTVNRTMNFRVSVRDRRGGMVDAGMTVTVAAGAGPFRVSSQDTTTTWAGNSTQTVTWDVAGTTGNGINAANVKISLSTDGGLSFPTTILASTPNDGSENLTVPNIGTTQGRIKVEAVGNIFFDINNSNITINASAAGIRAPYDYDGDDKTDLSIFRPSAGEWWYLRSSNGTNFAAQFGSATDRITPADFTGDQKTDFAFFRPATGQWFVLRSEDFSFFAFPFGTNGDTPVPADYDGDGKADAAVFRPSTNTWFIQKSAGGTDIIGFGAAGDKPAVGDYDGDGKADIAIFRPTGVSGSEWWIRRSSNATVFALQFGTSTDKPVQGFYTADNKTDIAFWRPSNGNWFVLRSEDFSFFAVPFGTNGDVPVPGDYDGDDRFDTAVFRPSSNTWFVQRSTAGTLIQAFGIAGDLPTPNAFVP